MSSGERRLEETGLIGSSGRPAGERREHTRVAMLSNVTLRIPTAADDASTDREEDAATLIRGGRSGDVSLGGMFVESPEPMAPGTRVEATFEVPDREEVEVPAEVRWTRKPGQVTERTPWKFGIRFLDLDEQQRDLLADFVSQRQSA